MPGSSSGRTASLIRAFLLLFFILLLLLRTFLLLAALILTLLSGLAFLVGALTCRIHDGLIAILIRSGVWSLIRLSAAPLARCALRLRVALTWAYFDAVAHVVGNSAHDPVAFI